jgi:hypothetical protein
MLPVIWQRTILNWWGTVLPILILLPFSSSISWIW